MLREGEGERERKMEGEGEEEGRQKERKGERRCHFICIPFSGNEIHLPAQFSVKEVINSVASSLRLQGREGKCSAEAPGAGPGLRGVVSQCLQLFHW